MEDELNLPPGFRFTPSDEELVTFYLKPKILGEELPCNIVEEKEVYGGDKTPWEVFNSEKDKWQVSGKTKKSSIYVFVNLEKKKKRRKKKKEGWRNKEQFVRAAGCGTWDGQTGPKEIMNGNGEIIGVKRLLVFEMNDTSDNLKLLENLKKEKKTTGYWIMHEYSLVSDHSDSDYVLCEISRDDLRNSKIKSCPKRSSDLAIHQSYGEEDLATTSTSSGGGGGVEEKEDLQFRAMEKKIYCPWDDYLDVDEIFNYQSTEEIQAYACMAESFEGGLEQQQQQQRDIKVLGKRKIEDEDEDEDTTTN